MCTSSVGSTRFARSAGSNLVPQPILSSDKTYSKDTGQNLARVLRVVLFTVTRGLVSVRQRVEEDIDTDGVPGGGELIEVSVVVALAFERIAEVGVVRHEDEHVSLLIADGARVRHGAVGAALRRAAAGAQPEVDRRDLRQLPNVVEDMKDRMIRRHVEKWEFPGWQRFPDLIFPVRPRVLPPEIVCPQETAANEVVVQMVRFLVAEVRATRLGHHDERTVIDFRIGQTVDSVVELALSAAADRRDGELGKAEAQVDVGAWIVDEPAVAVAVRRVVEPDAAEHEGAVVLGVRLHVRLVDSEPAAAPLGAPVSGDQG